MQPFSPGMFSRHPDAVRTANRESVLAALLSFFEDPRPLGLQLPEGSVVHLMSDPGFVQQKTQDFSTHFFYHQVFCNVDRRGSRYLFRFSAKEVLERIVLSMKEGQKIILDLPSGQAVFMHREDGRWVCRKGKNYCVSSVCNVIVDFVTQETQFQKNGPCFIRTDEFF